MEGYSKNEMDILRMSESERICWLMANRLTLIVVGVIWIGMILNQVKEGTIPLFMIVMVPVFALFRLAVYRYYKKSVGAGSGHL